MNHTASKHLEPFALVLDLQFERWLCEGEVVLGPLLLGLTEKMVHQPLEDILQVIGNGLALWALHPILSLEMGGRIHFLLIE